MLSDPRSDLLTWVEVDESALIGNLQSFRRRVPAGAALQVVVKSNAYGHGLGLVARALAGAGVDSFGVHTIEEAEALSRLALGRPVLILGYLGRGQAERAAAIGAQVTVYNVETLEALSRAAQGHARVVDCHVKVETGVSRQGILVQDLPAFLERLASLPGLRLAGVSTHFANIEDTTDPTYARMQIDRFQAAAAEVRRRAPDAVRHCACTAAVLALPETSLDMVRVGIGLYGLWPSKETLLSCLLQGKEEAPLLPALAWKARIAQRKRLPADTFVGYGCTHRTTRATDLAVIPIGYADGYDRRLSGIGHVLVAGRRAPVLGRICMNIFMIDVTDIPEARLESEVVLLGRQGSEEIGAAQIASLCHTISYEVVSRIAPHIPRIRIDAQGAPHPA